MKTLSEIQTAAMRSTMRSHAMEFRKNIHPDRDWYGFSERVNRAAFYIQQAILYRDMLARNRVAV